MKTLTALVTVAIAAVSLNVNAASIAITSDLGLSLTNTNTGIISTLFIGEKDKSKGALITTFDDESMNSAQGSGEFPSDMQSVAALSNFDGLDVAGTWNLNIWDSFAPNEGDTLFSWSIWGELEGGDLFKFDGDMIYNVDTIPATIASIVVPNMYVGKIADLNVSVAIDNLAEVPVPAAIWLFGAGIAGVFGFKRYSRKS